MTNHALIAQRILSAVELYGTLHPAPLLIHLKTELPEREMEWATAFLNELNTALEYPDIRMANLLLAALFRTIIADILAQTIPPGKPQTP